MSPAKRKAKVERPWSPRFDLAEGETLAQHLLKHSAGIGLAAHQKARLRYAVMLVDTVGGRKVTNRMKADSAAIANQVAAELGEGLSETVRLELARGGTVTREDGARTRRSLGDGLANLYDTGGLTGMTEAEREADGTKAADAWAKASARYHGGLGYREQHERLSAGVRSQLAEQTSAGGLRAPAFVGWLRAMDGHGCEALLAQVLAADRTGRALNVLRAVAGEGATLNSLDGRGCAREANLAALIVALDVCVACGVGALLTRGGE